MHSFSRKKQKKAIQLMVNRIDLTTNGIAVYLKPEKAKKRDKITDSCSYGLSMVEDKGFEPSTFWLPAKRSPS